MQSTKTTLLTYRSYYFTFFKNISTLLFAEDAYLTEHKLWMVLHECASGIVSEGYGLRYIPIEGVFLPQASLSIFMYLFIFFDMIFFQRICHSSFRANSRIWRKESLFFGHCSKVHCHEREAVAVHVNFFSTLFGFITYGNDYCGMIFPLPTRTLCAIICRHDSKRPCACFFCLGGLPR